MATNANTTKTRTPTLIRTDDKVPGVVSFYDRRVEDVNKAFIGRVDVAKMLKVDERLMPGSPLIKAAIHGITQNILDSSNKLEGDERVAYIKSACKIVQEGGWASAPVDLAAARENAISALVKLNIPRAQAEAMVAAQMPKN